MKYYIFFFGVSSFGVCFLFDNAKYQIYTYNDLIKVIFNDLIRKILINLI
jgi:hypothetical protein